MNNSFGRVFRINTWGESHGKAIGVVIDGCPAGLEICDAEINSDLAKRAPGNSPFTSPRKEKDQATIVSGTFEGKTTGAPICIIIPNEDIDSSKYEPIKDHLRPGHANYTYLQKYGVFDYRGGGRASARETACRVAAGAIAKKILLHAGIHIFAYMKEIGGCQASIDYAKLQDSKDIWQSPLYCPDAHATKKMMELLEISKSEQDSLGGVVELYIPSLPAGLGDPVYGKIDALLAFAMLSLPASKGFEIGEGFLAARMKGSMHNDGFTTEDGKITTTTNHAGGLLGGITTGSSLIARVAFKPTSSIAKKQESTDVNGQPLVFELPAGSRHDPCVAIRAVPIVAAMAAIVLVDALLYHRLSKI